MFKFIKSLSSLGWENNDVFKGQETNNAKKSGVDMAVTAINQMNISIVFSDYFL